MDGFDYNIMFDNSTGNKGTMILYQLFPENKIQNAFPVVWFSKPMYPNTKAYYGWDEEFCVVWSETMELEPGIKCLSNQSKSVDPQGKNLIDLNYDQTYYLDDPVSYRLKDNFFIRQSCNMPQAYEVSAGIGMMGKPTFVAQATPCCILEFSAKVEYWVAFGNYTIGQVLDPFMVMNPVQVNFPRGVTTMIVKLDKNNEWRLQAVH